MEEIMFMTRAMQRLLAVSVLALVGAAIGCVDASGGSPEVVPTAPGEVTREESSSFVYADARAQVTRSATGGIEAKLADLLDKPLASLRYDAAADHWTVTASGETSTLDGADPAFKDESLDVFADQLHSLWATG